MPCWACARRAATPRLGPMTRVKNLPAAVCSASLALVLVACGAPEDRQIADAPRQTATTPGEPTEAAPDSPAPTEGSQDDGDGDTQATSTAEPAVLTAVALAEAEAGGTAFEVDDRDGGTWEVDVAVGDDVIEVRISDDGTEVLGSSPDGTLDSDERAALDVATVTIADAIRIALAEVDGEVEDVDLDSVRGAHAWEVTIDHGSDDTEVYVSVTTGEILRIDRD